MRILNWRKKLASALLAAGMISPAAARAAEVNVNLVVNPGFENVDLDFVSYYNAPNILDWAGLLPGFCYSHDLSGFNVPDFANGGPLAGGASWYFSPGNGGNHSLEQAITQDIDVSTGATAAAIDGGSATFSLSAFFSTYAQQADRGFVLADFLDSASDSLGTALVATPADDPLSTWTQFTTTGSIPAGTQTIRMSCWGEQFDGQTGSADGYTDNVSFIVMGAAALAADFDSDNDVDGADMLTWQRGFGTTTGAAKAQGNANASLDGDVDGDDFSVWKQEFSEPNAVATMAATPEPGSIALVGVGLAMLAASVRRMN